ncbi:hypothetical protein F0919_15415 [Taibaiella lutea]|uniref:Uncharacterized protein n=1 Tax=Taibaiella lutea TaxID=2608001 RepID=A0A5M6CAJ0_9BACT|nr:hypothetical protein [Taibaiella lutea]KAA5532188.1 hypothetical protein F0919_15415 [Taibaiella lutea]
MVSEIKSDISIILNENTGAEQNIENGKIFSLSALRARLFKAGYTAREINATMASYAKRGLMTPLAGTENDGQYVFNKKAYEV